MIEPRSSLAAGATGWIRTGTPLILFVALGLPAGAVGVAWPQMRASLGAPLAGLGLLLAAYTAAYFVASAASGFLGARLGTAALLAAGCGLAAAGLIGLSLATRWWMVPAVTLLLGGGSGLIDAAANAHTSLNRGVRFMGWLHASCRSGRRARGERPSARWRPRFLPSGFWSATAVRTGSTRGPTWIGHLQQHSRHDRAGAGRWCC